MTGNYPNLEAANKQMNQPTADSAVEFAYVIPLEKFVYKINGAWNLSEPVGKEGIKNFLVDNGWPADIVKSRFQAYDYLRVYGHDLAPGKPDLFRDDADGRFYINTWVRPEIQPVAGEYPRITRVLDWLTKGDAEGKRWLMHWMARKIQNPELVPKVAVVLATQQGGGKGTLAFLMRQMLGEANTAIVKREELGNKFNKRWIGKLFVLGDEVLSTEGLKDISNLLKVLIDGNEIELEGKGVDQKAITNRLAWMFASNDRVTPIVLEKGDRRYSFFANHDPLPPDYIESMNSSFEADRKTPTPEFKREIQAFYYDLLQLEVDQAFVSLPYQNTWRDQLITANKHMHELFIEHVNEHGLDEQLTAIISNEDARSLSDRRLSTTASEWDFGEEGVAVSVVYRCYAEYCKQNGGRPMKLSKFGAAIANADKPWPYKRVSRDKRKVGAYAVPRKPREEAP